MKDVETALAMLKDGAAVFIRGRVE